MGVVTRPRPQLQLRGSSGTAAAALVLVLLVGTACSGCAAQPSDAKSAPSSNSTAAAPKPPAAASLAAPTPARAANTTVKPAGGGAADPPGSLHALLTEHTPLFRSLLDVLGIRPDSIQPTTVGTWFAPTDQAVQAFLKSMGLSAKELAARPALVDLIASYHFVPGRQLSGPADIGGSVKVAASGDDQFLLRLGRAAGKLTASDVQRNKAVAIKGPLAPKDTPGLNVFVVDKVLASGNYFPSVAAALKHSPYWIKAHALIDKAGVLPKLAGKPVTLLVPTNAAITPLGANISAASPARLAQILQYHTLPTARAVPDGFAAAADGAKGQPAGAPVPTATLLEGHKLGIAINTTTEVQDPFQRRRVVVPRVTLTPEAGRPARIVTYNIFAGPAILHGIDGVLMPKLGADTAAAAGAEPDDTAAPEEQVDAEDVLDAKGELRGPEATGSVAQPPGSASSGPRAKQPSRGSTAWPAGLAPRGGAAGLRMPDDDDSDSDDDSNSGTGTGMQRPAAPSAVGALKSKGRGGLKPLIIPRIAGGARPARTPPGGSGAAQPRGGGVVDESGLALTVVQRPGGARAAGTPPAPGTGPAADAQPSDAAAAAGDGGAAAPGGPAPPAPRAPGSNTAAGRPTTKNPVSTSSTWGDFRHGDNAADERAVHDENLASGAGDPGRRRLQALFAAGLRALLQQPPRMRQKQQQQQQSEGPATMAIGAVGQLQTFANGITANKTSTALAQATQPVVPKQYVNRFGSLPGPAARGGCLNCLAWGKQE